MKIVPEKYLTACSKAGQVVNLPYGNKYTLLYEPAVPAEHILYLIHGGGGNKHAFFCPDFLNMVDHMIEDGVLKPLYIVSPCFYDPDEKDKTPSSSGRAVTKFSREMREQIIPVVESHLSRSFPREARAISGFSMGGVTTWYAFLQALDLFYWFMPLSGDCWACGEKGGGDHPEETARVLVSALEQQGNPDFRIHAVTGSADIAFPNLDPQIRAMEACPEFKEKMKYDVLEGGVHDYPTIFRYLYNYMAELFG